ncbi:hypothetical protein J6590_082057 [Homalodisca vitripennis]|nr:hypothetical protein J6590_082057 [Homalodisca vitripennis]
MTFSAVSVSFRDRMGALSRPIKSLHVWSPDIGEEHFICLLHAVSRIQRHSDEHHNEKAYQVDRDADSNTGLPTAVPRRYQGC